ncbi:MAG: hypothetical protein O2914_04835 [Bacteroidetes bacterium]|nr:hypothetical protein [Bacteroidota bacterium]MDA0938141.1 hypothetical protein [Bacteroidota bacterium]MDA1344519.1 hypothetical protein [Bacteroidota bacterium]
MRTRAFSKLTPLTYFRSILVLTVLFFVHYYGQFQAGFIPGLKHTGLLYLLSITAIFLWGAFYRNNGLPQTNSRHLLYFPMLLPLFFFQGQTPLVFLMLNLWLLMNYRHHITFWMTNISANKRLVKDLFDWGLLMALILILGPQHLLLLLVFFAQLLLNKIRDPKHYFVPLLPLITVPVLAYTIHQFSWERVPLFDGSHRPIEPLEALTGLQENYLYTAVVLACILFLSALRSKGATKRINNLKKTNLILCLIVIYWIGSEHLLNEAILLTLPLAMLLSQIQERFSKISAHHFIVLLLLLFNLLASPLGQHMLSELSL